MSDTTPRIGLPWLMPAQAQKHVTVNESLARLDALVQAAVLSRTVDTQPADPQPGDAYILPQSAGGADWSGFFEGDLAYFQDGAWSRIAARPGFTAYIADEGALVMHDGAAWTAFSNAIITLGNLESLGVGTAPDAANPFAAKLNQALWTALPSAEGGTGDLRYTLNKEGEPDTLSVLFQSGWSGRAEIGLTGSDDLVIKVSPDGSAWTEALSIARADGAVSLDRAHLGRLESLNGGPLGGFRNVVINGDFTVWQRGPSVTPASGERFADQWMLFSNSDDALTCTQESFALGQSDVPGMPRHYLRANITPGSSGSLNDLRQKLEDVAWSAGETVTVAFWARSSAACTITLIFQQTFGLGGSASTAFGQVGFSLDTQWSRYERTVTFPSVAGKTLGDRSSLDLIFRLPVNTALQVDIADVQMEKGGVATPFERRPHGVDLALCRRQLERKTVRAVNGARHIPLSPKRALPSVTVSAGSAGHVTEDGFELSHNADADCIVEASAEL